MEAPRYTGKRLAALRVSDPELFRGVVRGALVPHGKINLAAKALEVHDRTLRQWLKDDAILRESCVLHGPGRTPKTKGE